MDSALTECLYYDANQNLRFVFIEGRAACGSVMEHRIYFDPNRARIWEIQKYLQEPEGYWSDVWPEDMLIFDPWLDFTS